MAKKHLKQMESYRKMVAQLAWRTWRCLPIQVKTWISIEDMIEDGIYAVYRILAGNSKYVYDPSRGAEMGTVLYHRLHSFYIRNYIEVYGAEKRGWEKVNGKL